MTVGSYREYISIVLLNIYSGAELPRVQLLGDFYSLFNFLPLQQTMFLKNQGEQMKLCSDFYVCDMIYNYFKQSIKYPVLN